MPREYGCLNQINFKLNIFSIDINFKNSILSLWNKFQVEYRLFSFFKISIIENLRFECFFFCWKHNMLLKIFENLYFNFQKIDVWHEIYFIETKSIFSKINIDCQKPASRTWELFCIFWISIRNAHPCWDFKTQNSHQAEDVWNTSYFSTFNGPFLLWS